MSIQVDVRELVAQPGVSKRHSVDEPVAGLATELCRVPEDTGVRADLLLEGVVEGVLVVGPVSGVMAQTCARCLRTFDSGFEVEVNELYSPQFLDSGDDHGYPLPAIGTIDLEPMVRDAVIPEMPFAPLCTPECLGLCPMCGGDRNLGECSCPPEADDLRLGSLADIRIRTETRERTS